MKQELEAIGSCDPWHAEDGTVLRMRPIAAGDAADLVSFVQRLSFGARYFGYGRLDFNLTYDHAQLECNRDSARRLHLLVLTEDNATRSIVASGRIVFEPGAKRCELEMVVADAWQRRGLGRRLLTGLIDGARQSGLEEMRATVLVTNTAMVSFLLLRGFRVPEPADGKAIRVARLDLRRAQSVSVAPEAWAIFSAN